MRRLIAFGGDSLFGLATRQTRGESTFDGEEA